MAYTLPPLCIPVDRCFDAQFKPPGLSDGERDPSSQDYYSFVEQCGELALVLFASGQEPRTVFKKVEWYQCNDHYLHFVGDGAATCDDYVDIDPRENGTIATVVHPKVDVGNGEGRFGNWHQPDWLFRQEAVEWLVSHFEVACKKLLTITPKEQDMLACTNIAGEEIMEVASNLDAREIQIQIAEALHCHVAQVVLVTPDGQAFGS